MKLVNGDSISSINGYIQQPPKYVGGYDIAGNKGGAYSIQFNMIKKPNTFHRICSKVFLGWDWVDKK